MLANCCKERYSHLPAYATLSKIILIKDVKLKTAAANLGASDTSKLVESIKGGIESFLNTEYNWQRSRLSVTDGSFRTKQIVLLTNDKKLSLDEKETKLNEIALRTDCTIRVTDEKFDGQLSPLLDAKKL